MTNFDLKVPYAEKDAAKALGAWWSMERKTWFVPSGVRLEPFAKWLPAEQFLADAARAEKAIAKAAAKLDGIEKGLSMTPAAIRSREKKARKAGRARVDENGGRITVGEHFAESDATGLPWD